jgi:hypothetical protein
MAKVTTSLFGDLSILINVAEVPTVEFLSFLTDVIEHEDGTEQRIQLRNKPRQEFAYQLKVKSNNDSDAFNTLWGSLRGKWAIPVWTDAQFVGNISIGSNFILADLANYDLRASSLAMLFDGCGNYQVLEISTLSGGGINLTTPTKEFRNSMLMPVRIGILDGNVSKPTNGYIGKVSIKYRVEDNKEFSPSAPAQYLGNDIYLEPPISNGEFPDQSIAKRQDLVDFELGKFEQRSPWLISKVGKNFRVIAFNRAELTTFKNFFYRRVGKFRPFWMPSFENNIRLLNTGVVTSTLLCTTDSYIPYTIGRTNIAIQANDVWYVRTLSAPTALDSSTMQLTLSSALNVPALAISRVCYLGLYRLDTDSAELTYSSPSMVECNLRVLEIAI